MAARTDEDAVLELLGETDRVKFPSVQPFIDSATNIVTRLCVPAGYDDETLELIERWLAAHLYCVADPRLAEDQTGKGRYRFDTKLGMNLDVTLYGQQVKLFDSEGTLTAVSDAKTTAWIFYGGAKSYDDFPRPGEDPYAEP